MEKDRDGSGQCWSNIIGTEGCVDTEGKKIKDIKFSLNKEELNLQVKRTHHVPEKFDTK